MTDKQQIEKLKKRNKELVKGLHDIIRHHKILSPTCYKKSAAAYIALGLVGDPND